MKRVNRIQKLARHEEKAVISRIFWLTAVSVILIFVIFTVGVNFLGNFADFLTNLFKGNQSTQEDSSFTPPPPSVDALPKATNKDAITILGSAIGASKVEIYQDSSKINEIEVVEEKFEFVDFRLKTGENNLQFKAIASSGNTSDFSETIIIVLDTKEPDLEVESPTDNQHFSGNNRIKVIGKTEPDIQVLVNNFLANVNSDGKFEVTVPLEVDGENKIEVKAQDEAGNSKVKEIKVHFKK